MKQYVKLFEEFYNQMDEGRFAGEARSRDELAAWIDPDGKMYTVRTTFGGGMWSHIGWFRKNYPDVYPELDGRELQDRIMMDGWVRVSFVPNPKGSDVGIAAWTEDMAKRAVALMYEDFFRSSKGRVYVEWFRSERRIGKGTLYFELSDAAAAVNFMKWAEVGEFAVKNTVR